MPRNGSGTYSLPPIYLATPGTTIQAQQHNDPLTDIAAAMSASVASDGQTPMTGALNANGNKITGVAEATNPSDAVRFDQISDPSDVALDTLRTYGWAVVGNAPTIANIDATNTASGQYRFVTGATGTLPTGVIAADTGQIIMIRETVNEGSMIMAVGAGRVFWRVLVAGVWGAWQENIMVPASAGAGIVVRTGAGAVALRTVTSADSSVTITNSDGVAGNIDLSVALTAGWEIVETLDCTSGTTKETSNFEAGRDYLFIFQGVSAVSGSGTFNVAWFGETAGAYTAAQAFTDGIASTNFAYGEFLYRAPKISRKVHNVWGVLQASATAPTSDLTGEHIPGRQGGFANYATAQGVSKVRFSIAGGIAFDVGTIVVLKR